MTKYEAVREILSGMDKEAIIDFAIHELVLAGVSGAVLNPKIAGDYAVHLADDMGYPEEAIRRVGEICDKVITQAAEKVFVKPTKKPKGE